MLVGEALGSPNRAREPGGRFGLRLDPQGDELHGEPSPDGPTLRRRDSAAAPAVAAGKSKAKPGPKWAKSWADARTEGQVLNLPPSNLNKMFSHYPFGPGDNLESVANGLGNAPPPVRT